VTNALGLNQVSRGGARVASKLCRPLRVAIIADFPEERWPSMDLVADTLAEGIKINHVSEISVSLIRPRFRRRFSAFAQEPGRLMNLDRALNRFIDYPLILRRLRKNFDLFHVADHSYAHLVHYLPAERTLVTCHDLETFRCLLEPDRAARSIAFGAMTRRILAGLQSAAVIACVSEATRQDLLRNEIAKDERCVTIPNGVSPVFTPAANAVEDAEAIRLLGSADASIEILNVGSTVPRKRIDRLLRVIAGIRERWPQVRLVRVGGEFTREQQKMQSDLELNHSVISMPPISAATLAAVYRRAALLFIMSDREGFGLPLIEALACGTPVLASAIPALRETGSHAAAYASAGNLEEWIDTANTLLSERADDPCAWAARREAGLAHVRKFSWNESVAQIVALYRQVAN
jgi:glycosyltransferase involved in cell wall biosynthesis